MDVLNINVGILGHVDSGKTTLAKCLSQISTTAAFDKNPQSQERGITLDLGFSSFALPMPENMKPHTDKTSLQFTLVDCPGHASLIKTIIGGAQIIDMMLLVIDVTKGIQTQTAECVVIGNLLKKRMIVVLNKVDLLDEKEEKSRQKHIASVKSRIQKVLEDSCGTLAIVETCANFATNRFEGVEELKRKMAECTQVPERSGNGPFHFAIDHCFAIKGQGTVMTGTILQGSVKVNDVIELPSLGISKKVRSMQMFRTPIDEARQGDRVGICITQVDPKKMERSIACSTNFGGFITQAIIDVNRIEYFKFPIESKAKFHITIGYETALGQITLFQRLQNSNFTLDNEYEFVQSMKSDESQENANEKSLYAFIQLENAIFAAKESIVIGSKLDLDINKKDCRIAFWGRLLDHSKENELSERVKIFKMKEKSGIVDRIADEHNVIVRNMFEKESVIEKFQNFTVSLTNGVLGRIEGNFGKSGKVKIYCENGIGKDISKNSEVKLHFKKFLFIRGDKISQ